MILESTFQLKLSTETVCLEVSINYAKDSNEECAYVSDLSVTLARYHWSVSQWHVSKLEVFQPGPNCKNSSIRTKRKTCSCYAISGATPLRVDDNILTSSCNV